MPAGEEVGHLDERSADLRHRVRHVAVAEILVEVDHVAVGKAITLIGNLVRSQCDIGVQDRGRVKIAEVELAKLGETRPSALGELGAPGGRPIGQMVAERRELALVDTKDRRVLRIFRGDLLGEALQLRIERWVPRCRRLAARSQPCTRETSPAAAAVPRNSRLPNIAVIHPSPPETAGSYRRRLRRGQAIR